MGDFGLAVQLEHSFSERSIICGTLVYMAPEVFEERSCLKSDVWSLGISVIEMAEGKHPFAGFSEEDVKNATPSLSSAWSSDLVDFVNKCLVKDVDERASVEALLKVSVVVMV